MGKRSKLIVCGDPEQCDLRELKTRAIINDLPRVADALEGLPRVSIIRFPENECHRSKVAASCLHRLRGL
jgi:phosphate starvation-inducible protein PhoH